MTAEQYIRSELEKLKTPSSIQPEEDLESQIVRLLLSKKFRKYSANDALIQHVKASVHENVSKQQPINLTFLHGAYKLWRLDESPEADWAELFALMYYTKYVKQICEIYEPGIWFDFFVDDWIVEMMDNITTEEISSYLNSYQKIIDYLKEYQPNNLKMTVTTVSSRFNSREEFDAKIKEKLSSLPLPELSESEQKMVELNVRPVNDTTKNPKWREEIFRLHNAYLIVKSEAGYHKNRLDKILVFNQPLPGGTTISLGTTKSSIAKFWVGVGALKPANGSYKMIILSPSQLESASFKWENIDIGLQEKNFNKIRILK